MTSLPGARLLSTSIRQICHICHQAWLKNLMNGWSGNASLRLGQDCFLITRAGTPKGMLGAGDCLVLDKNGKILLGTGKPSSEWRMHIALYEKFAECTAILHTHPPALQSLDITCGNAKQKFLNLPLFECAIWRPRLYFSPKTTPGSSDLAMACAMACPDGDSEMPLAIWLEGHGLCAMAKDPAGAFCLTEELEHLAHVQINCQKSQRCNADAEDTK